MLPIPYQQVRHEEERGNVNQQAACRTDEISGERDPESVRVQTTRHVITGKPPTEVIPRIVNECREPGSASCSVDKEELAVKHQQVDRDGDNWQHESWPHEISPRQQGCEQYGTATALSHLLREQQEDDDP